MLSHRRFYNASAVAALSAESTRLPSAESSRKRVNALPERPLVLYVANRKQPTGPSNAGRCGHRRRGYMSGHRSHGTRRAADGFVSAAGQLTSGQFEQKDLLKTSRCLDGRLGRPGVVALLRAMCPYRYCTSTQSGGGSTGRTLLAVFPIFEWSVERLCWEYFDGDFSNEAN